jgi:tetratricopeptide (TPR) repeat protein
LVQQRHDEPADRLEELESLGERLMQWVGANPVIVLTTAGLILLLAAGVGGWRAYEHSRADKASAALAKLQGDFVTAMGGKPTDVEVPEPANPETARTVRTDFADRFLALAEDWRGTATGALALLQAGQLYEQLGNRERALELWSQAAANTPSDSPALGVIQSRIGHLQEDRGDFDAAARAHEAAAAVPGFPLYADALADAARCWAEAGKPTEALAAYQRLKTDSPEHPLAPHVEARLAELEAVHGAGPAPTTAPPTP